MVISRKNFLFAYSVAGVRALCIHMSLIRSAILYGFDPYYYYVAIMKAIPYCQTVEDYEKLLSWAIDLPKGSEEEQQQQEEVADMVVFRGLSLTAHAGSYLNGNFG